MEAAAPPLPGDTWETLPSEVQVLILCVESQAVTLPIANAAVQERIRELEGRLGQDSSPLDRWWAALWRKGSFGSDSDAGSRFVERMLTVVAACRQQARRLLDIVVAAGEVLLQGTPAPSLLPAR